MKTPAYRIVGYALLALIVAASSAAVVLYLGQQARIREEIEAATPEFTQGKVLETRGDYKGAAEHYKKATEAAPGFQRAYFELGGALYELQDNSGAEEAFGKALRLNPGDTRALHMLALIRSNRGDVEAAASLRRRIVELEPDDALNWNLLAMALAEKCDAAGAAKAYRRNLRLDPGFTWVPYDLGNALYDSGDLKGALQAYKEVTPDVWVYEEAQLAVALINDDLGKKEEALGGLEILSRLKPGDGGYRFLLGLVLYRMGRVGPAVAEYRAALVYRPNFQPARLSLAVALTDMQQYKEAVDHFFSGVLMDPRMGKEFRLEDFFPRGFDAKKGNPEETAKRLKAKIAPLLTEGWTHYRLAVAQARGATSLAMVHLRRAMKADRKYASLAREDPAFGDSHAFYLFSGIVGCASRPAGKAP